MHIGDLHRAIYYIWHGKRSDLANAPPRTLKQM
jgi:hypothetical protein